MFFLVLVLYIVELSDEVLILMVLRFLLIKFVVFFKYLLWKGVVIGKKWLIK